jgi:two-component system sensor histidine kinase BaeS
MGWLKTLRQSSWIRFWTMAVLPMSMIFLVDGLVIRWMVLMRLHDSLPPNATVPNNLLAPGTFVIVGTLVGMVVYTAWSIYFVHWLIEPYTRVARVAGELAQGNYDVRVDLSVRGTSTYRDLAEKVNALAESIQRTEYLRRDLVGNMAHEIRTPLTNIQGYLEALRDGVIEPNHEAIESVHEEVMRLVRLVDVLHQLARADALRQQPMEMQLTNLDSLADQLVRVIRPNALARSLKLYLDLDARKFLMPVHADSIAQVMRNLLRNAIQYADEGGIIRVQTHVTEGCYRFVCLNSGPGISNEDLPFIFKRFYRTTRAKQGVITGVGIGLAIAKELIEAHGGRIGAESKADWTSVWFELPTEPGHRLEPI